MSATFLPVPPESTSRARPVCRHCGAASPQGDFCCAGCAYVYRLVHEEGLQAYYRLKDAVTPPAELAVGPARSFAWLRTAQQVAEEQAAENTPEIFLDVQGISCAGCVWLIERIFHKQAGAGRIELNAQTGQIRLSWERGVFNAEVFAEALQRFNYLLGPASAARAKVPESRGLVRRIGLTAAFAMNIMLFALPAYFGLEAGHVYAHLFATLSMGFATLSVIVGGGYFFVRAFESLRAGIASIDLPIALGILGAYGGSFAGWVLGREDYVYFDFVGTFVVLMLVGRWAQIAAVERNQRQLLGQQPVGAPLRVRNAEGVIDSKLPSELREAETFWAGSGQTLPVESRVVDDAVEVSLAWINGESAPRTYRRGQSVPAGAIVLSRREIEFVARTDWKHSLVSSLLRPLERSGYRHRFIERVIQGYLVGIIVIAGGAGLFWALSTGDLLRTGSVVTAILVVSCPCAIGLAFPLADEIATVCLRRAGVFVRAHDLWPRLAKVRQVLFDKTGTLTLETPQLANAGDLEALEVRDLEALYSLVHDNPHPTARAVAEALLQQGAREAWPEIVEEEIGFGVGIERDGVTWTLGRRGWRSLAGEMENAGAVFSRNGIPLGLFHFEEHVRPGTPVEIVALQSRGLRICILSGDRADKVENLAVKLGIERRDIAGELSPGDKAELVTKLGADSSLMLGDGANDSLAFDRALCRGTPVIHRGMLEQRADFYYLGNSIAGIRALFEVDDVRRRTQRMLLVFSIGYNALAVGLAITGHMNPLLAAILMPLSSLVSLALVGFGMRPARQRVRASLA